MNLESIINNFTFEPINPESNLIKLILGCIENQNNLKLEDFKIEEIEKVLYYLSEVDINNPAMELVEFVSACNFLEKICDVEGDIDDEIYI